MKCYSPNNLAADSALIRGHSRSNRQAIRCRHRRALSIIEMSIVMTVLLLWCWVWRNSGSFFTSAMLLSAPHAMWRACCLQTAVQTDPVTRATATLAQANVTFNPSWMTIIDLTNSNSTVTDCSAIPYGDKLQVTIQCQYNLIPNAYRPLYAMTGKGIGNGKMCMGICQRIRE